MLAKKNPPVPNHVAGTAKGEEMVRIHGREPGRDPRGRFYRTARDSSSINPTGPIDPRMPSMPPA